MPSLTQIDLPVESVQVSCGFEFSVILTANREVQTCGIGRFGIHG